MQKENLCPTIRANKVCCGVVEIQPKLLGNVYGEYGTGFAGCVWGKEEISPGLMTMQGGGRQPMIIDTSQEINVLGNYHKSGHDASRIVDTKGIAPTVRENHGTVTAILDETGNNMKIEKNTVRIKQATKQGYAECEIGGVFDAAYLSSKTRRGRVQDNGNTCPTLTAENSDLYRVEDGISVESRYRIRKLTPRECGRLQGVSDEDITKMLEVNSNSQCYKQFGNSICIPVMEAMFEKLNLKRK